jgi:hypothetical protein
VRAQSISANHILRDAARAALAPLGLAQRGRSRTWVDDRGWHLIVVEFQPSSFGRGSHLNVGIMWLWHARDHVAFDTGGRVAGFRSSEEGDWASSSHDLASLAADRVREIQAEVRSVEDAARMLTATPPAPGWATFHAAVAAGLAGNGAQAATLFERVLPSEPTRDWQRDLQAHAEVLRRQLSDTDAFLRSIADDISRARQALRLAPRAEGQIRVELARRA